MRYKTLLKRGYSKSAARKLATPRKSSKDNCDNFDATKILKKVGLTKEMGKEVKIRRQIEHRGIITPVKTPCRCGGNAVLQEWGETLSKGIFKRYAVVFCRECDRKTKIYSERTANESRQEALNEWNILNRKEV